MLSGETAAGKFPIDTVTTMASIADRAEDALPYEIMLEERSRRAYRTNERRVRARGLRGRGRDPMPRPSSRPRTPAAPRCASRACGRGRPIVAVTHKARTSRMLALVWGVVPVLVGEVADLDTLVSRGVRAAVDLGVARSGDQVVVTAGIPIGRPGSTNFLKSYASSNLIGGPMVLTVDLAERFPRRFVPADADMGDFAQIEPVVRTIAGDAPGVRVPAPALARRCERVGGGRG